MISRRSLLRLIGMAPVAAIPLPGPPAVVALPPPPAPLPPVPDIIPNETAKYFELMMKVKIERAKMMMQFRMEQERELIKARLTTG